jgi:Xaa-Pro aminopeptidase
MTDFLFYADTERSAAARHELPLPIGDPFLLAIAGLGFYDLLDSGMSRHELELELASRTAAAIGVREAVADPALGQTGYGELVAGDVIAIEPGLWDRNIGEVRFEDLLLVTEDGCETLTQYPYELAPA